MAKRLTQTTWGTFSVRFVRYNALPYGCELRLYDRRGRRKRSDLVLKRQRVVPSNIAPAKGASTVRELLDAARALLSATVKERRWSRELYGPDGAPISNNTRIRNVRRLDPRPTRDEIQRREYVEERISEVEASARIALAEAEYLIDDPTEIVCPGFVRALANRFGRSAIMAVLR